MILVFKSEVRTPLFIELTAKLINKQKGNTTMKKNKVIGLIR